LSARSFFGAVAAVLGFYGAVVAVTLLLAVPISPSWIDGTWGVAIATAPVVVAATVVNGVLVWRGWATWGMLGWRNATKSATALLGGTVIGVGMAVVALAVTLVGGARLVTTGEPLAAYLGVAVPVAIGLLVAALAEELLFRGFPLQRLAQPLGKVWASVGLAVVFAGAHLWNPDVSTLGLVNIGLASLVLSAAFFTPGGLPLAWGVHVGWNGGLALGADAPVSGLTFDMPVLEFFSGRSEWVTGGAFGPEGGIAASIAMAVALIWLSPRATRPEEEGRT
jgi:membrane protease YdiL (CAAX protease family)